VTRIEAALRRLAEDLDGLGLVWALVGGLAVSTRSEPRLTRDVDVAVPAADDAAAEALVFALQQRGYEVRATLEQVRVGRLATVRLRVPRAVAKAVLVDVLFRSSGIEPEVVSAAERLTVFPGFSVPVARTGHLVAMKLLAFDERRRPQDYDDLTALLRVADAAEDALLEEALSLITARGFERGKDLREELRRIRERLRGA
jgi:predicted nucleotidyltransferase